VEKVSYKQGLYDIALCHTPLYVTLCIMSQNSLSPASSHWI